MMRKIVFMFVFLVILVTDDLYSFNSLSENSKLDRPTYTYGAKFEPPDGKVIHGMGQWERDNQAYLAMLADESLYPLTEIAFIDISPPRPWEFQKRRLWQYLQRLRNEQMIANINLGMSGPKQSENKKKNIKIPFGVDNAVANTTQYDQRIYEVARLLARYAEPVFLRIGGEFNGFWNGHHPYDYPKAFRKIVRIFQEVGAHNVAFIWCYEPVAADDFDEENSRGEYKWFPGDDVIDWYSIDVFGRNEFSDTYSGVSRRTMIAKLNAERFLKMAQAHRKPVMIAESSVVDIDVASQEVWQAWFEPYFRFIDAHPQIKAFVYINAEWPKYGYEQWQDGRITLNPLACEKYIREMRKDKYLHRGKQHLLKDYEKYTPK